QVKRIHKSLQTALESFQATAAKLPEKAQWGGVESATAQCIPADAVGSDHDLYHYPSRTIRCDHGDNKHTWFQTGEMVQVGMAWRLISGPSQGDAVEPDRNPFAARNPLQGDAPPPRGDWSKEMQKMMDELGALDREPPAASGIGVSEDVYKYNLKRIDLLERILVKLKTEEKVKPADRDQWVKQLVDCLSAACQNNTTKDTACFDRLTQIKDQITREVPNSPLAAYVTFRTLWAEYGPQLQKGGTQFAKVQKAW